jgi:hypothetical protein
VEHIEFVNTKAYWAVKEDAIARHLHGISRDEGERAKKKWSK